MPALVVAVWGIASARVSGIDGGYVGSDSCLSCHDGGLASDKTSFRQAGHPWKYRHTGGASSPTGRDPLSALLPTPLLTGLSTSTLNALRADDGSGRLDRSAINYAIGGYAWKIRWGIRDFGQGGGGNPAGNDTGHLWAGSQAQYNLENNSWSSYSSGQDKKYECALCHNTNGIVSTPGYSCATDPGTNASPARTQPWASNPGMGPQTNGGYYSSWSLDGVQCEACHGKGSRAGNNGHADLGAAVTQGVLTLPGGVEICAKCHIRANNVAGVSADCAGDVNPAILTGGAPISDPWIQHREQYQEMVGLNGDGVHASLTCTTCHDPHKRVADLIPSVATALGVVSDATRPEPGAIRKQCADCHGAQAAADAASAVAKVVAHRNAGVSCVDCHMAEAARTAINASTAGWGRKGDLKTHIVDINPTASGISRSNGFTTVAQNYISPRYACGKCHDGNIYGSVIAGPTSEAQAQAAAAGYHAVTGIDGGYVGSEACAGCHGGYYADFVHSGHPYKLRFTDGTVPLPETDPLSALLVATMPNVADLLNPNNETNVKVADPSGKLDWSAVSYVIGGFGWKARWGVKDPVDDSATGYIWSSTVSSPTGAQYNLLAADPALDPAGRRADWSTYGSATKRYQCAICHNTNGTSSVDPGCSTPLGSGRSEPWASTGLSYTSPGGFRSEWSLSGVQCEACHGTGAAHVQDPSGNPMTVTTSKDLCGKCHIRSGNTAGMGDECGGDANPAILVNGARITGDYINHHEQYNEMVGLNDGVHRGLECVSCHDPHVRSHRVTDAVAAALGIPDNDLSAEARGAVVSCQSCHGDKTLRYPMGEIACIDCHMAEATRTATNESPDGAWGRMGDVKTHVFKIDPAATTITRSNGFTNVATNALSVRYACGKCHDPSLSSYVGRPPLTLELAQLYAENMHMPPAPSYPVTFTTTVGSPNTLAVSVDARVICGGPCPDLTYDWNWGDGTPNGSGDPASHTYATAGAKTITLTVRLVSTGDRVGSSSRSLTLRAPDLPPTAAAACTWNAETWTMQVVDASTDDGPDGDTLPGDGDAALRIVVDWGDGSTRSIGAQGATYTRTYTMSGTFTVTVRAIDAKLQQDVTTCAVQATPARFVISGTIQDRLGTKNLASAAVRVVRGATVIKTLYSKANGTFTVASLRPGTYTLRVTRKGYTFANPAATIVVGPDSTGNVINATAP